MASQAVTVSRVVSEHQTPVHSGGLRISAEHSAVISAAAVRKAQQHQLRSDPEAFTKLRAYSRKIRLV